LIFGNYSAYGSDPALEWLFLVIANELITPPIATSMLPGHVGYAATMLQTANKTIVVLSIFHGVLLLVLCQ
jgi:hypothetical protein